MPSEQHVGHAEVRAHAADVDGDRRLAREAVLRASPTSAVVPPMSTTAQSSSPDRNAAPRIEFVGPEANVATG